MAQSIGIPRARGGSKWIWLTVVALFLAPGRSQAQNTRADSVTFDGKGSDILVEEVPGPPGERWSLARAVATALESSADARVAHARTIQARGGALSAWSGILPTVTGNLAYTRSYPDPNLSTSTFPDTVNGVPSTVSFRVNRIVNNTASATAQSNILSIPAISEKRRQNLLSRTASEAEAEARNGVVFDVKQQYFALVKAERLALVARESERLARDEETRAEALFEVGTVARGDVLKARARRATTQLDRIRAVNQVEIQRSRLKQVIGVKPDTPLYIETALDENVALPDSAGSIATALRSRPDLSRAFHAEKAARAGLFGARARRLPEVTGLVTVDRYKSTQRLEQLGGIGAGEFDETYWATEWYGEARLSLPIFNGFALEGNTKTARGALLEAETQRRQRELDVAVETQQAWLSVREAVERIDVAKEGLASAEEDYNFSKGRYDLGAGTFLDLLNSEVTLAQARQSYVEAVADAHVAEASLERAVGARRY